MDAGSRRGRRGSVGAGVAVEGAEVEGRAVAPGVLDLAELLLVAGDGLLEALGQGLGGQRRQDHPAVDLDLFNPGQGAGEVEDELGRGDRDMSGVGVGALGDVVGQLDAHAARLVGSWIVGVGLVHRGYLGLDRGGGW